MISLARLNELLLRGEATHIDYKVKLDTGKAHKGDLELTKDIMALANALHPGLPEGFLLIGVHEDPDTRLGVVSGLDSSILLDDADYHQMIGGKLNRCPRFEFYLLDHPDGQVAIFHILADRRPYYPKKDLQFKDLKKNQPLVRNGTSTDLATPDRVYLWAREDDVDAREVRDLQRRKLEADLRPEGAIEGRTNTRGPDASHGYLEIRHLGGKAFTVERVRGRVELAVERCPDEGRAVAAKSMEDAQWIDIRFPRVTLGPGRESESQTLRVSRDAIHRAHAAYHHDRRPPEKVEWTWWDLVVEASCSNSLGIETVLRGRICLG